MFGQDEANWGSGSLNNNDIEGNSFQKSNRYRIQAKKE